MALWAAATLGVDPAATLGVDDSLLDIERGTAAGMLTCGVTTVAHPRERLEPADAVVDRLPEIPHLLDTLS